MVLGSIATGLQEGVEKCWIPAKGNQSEPDSDAHHLLRLGEELRFYHRTHFDPWGFSPLLFDNEVLVTNSRVVVTESCLARVNVRKLGLPGDAVDRWNQQSFDREVVRGYEATRVIPKLVKLVLPVLGLLWCMFVICERTPNMLDILHDVVVLLPLEHTLWIFGGTCRSLPICKHTIASPLKLASRAISQSKQTILRMSLEEGGRKTMTGSRVKGRARSQFLTVDSGQLASMTTFEGGSSMSYLSTTSLPDEDCLNFNPWHDLDGNACARYNEPDWLFSCRDTSIASRLVELEERRDPNLKLSPSEACCACGGSEAKARARSISRLAGAVYDALESMDNTVEVESQLPAQTVAILREVVLDGGKEALEVRMLNMTNQELANAGKLAGSSSGHLYFSSPAEVLPALELLVELFPAVSDVAAARAALETPDVHKQMEDMENQLAGDASHESPADRAKRFLIHMMRAISCLWRIFWIATLVACAARIQWWLNLLRRPVTYVVLRRHEKYFGPQSALEGQDDVLQNRFSPENLVGFFVPSERLNEFAAALCMTGGQAAV